jgi:SAM-dependent methyltransferase
MVLKTVRLARRPWRVYQSGDAGPPEDWGAIARIYDLEHPACRGAELAFWHQMATETGGPVLELAAGSGRIAIALARKGHHVTGLELAAGMLARARARTARLPPAVAGRLQWVQGDMARFTIPWAQFRLVFVAYNSFWLLTDLRAQRRCLDCVRRHLAPGGRLVLDVFPPNDDDYQDERGIIQLVAAPWRGRHLVRVKDYTYNPRRQLAISDVRYYPAGPQAGQPGRLLATFRYCLRLATPQEMQALLEQAGYRIEATYGTYRRDPLAPDTPRAIFVAGVGP